ncbi:MAG: TIGR02117 family protein [Bacteroidota bacterium]
MIKKAVKIVWRAFLAILGFLVLYFLLAFLLTIIPANSNFEPDPDGVDLYIISNGVHTDICFATKDANLDWEDILNFEYFKTPKNRIQYLSVGWGDKGFYFDTPTWADLSVKTALTAALFPSPTAMHVTTLRRTPTEGEKIRKTSVSKAQLLAMENYIKDHLQLKNDKAILIDCCRYEGADDNFYEAEGSYHMLRTCNTWANQVLKTGGIRTATWAPFDKCILYHFENKKES